MSTGIRMALVVNLLSLLFSAALVCSDQSKVPIRSFKISENAIYDCMDIYKQPGLNHPLLTNHKIQMKPSSVLSHESTNETSNNTTYKHKIRCPEGTVPILRNTKKFNTSAQFGSEKYFHPFTVDSPRTHIAGVRSRTGPYRGVQALFNAYYLDVRNDQASYNQIYIGSGLNNEVNFMQTGLMINPSLYGDEGLWSYAFWQGKDGKGCYNMDCPGFVQVSHQVPIVEPVKMNPRDAAFLRRTIHQDKNTGNWWITNLSPTVNIGYWPKELFSLMGNGGNLVGVGGVVQASQLGPSPPMGDGQFPTPSELSFFRNVKVWNSNYEAIRIDAFPVEKLLDSPQCYGLTIGTNLPNHDPRGYFFEFGGPGGASCGI